MTFECQCIYCHDLAEDGSAYCQRCRTIDCYKETHLFGSYYSKNRLKKEAMK